MGPKSANKRPKSVVGHKVVLKNGSNKPAKKISSIIKQPARLNRPKSGGGDKKKVKKVVKSSATVTKIIKQDFQRPVAQRQKQQQRQPKPQQSQQQQQLLPPPQQQSQPRGRGSAGHMYSSANAGGSFMAGSMALQTAQAVASNRGHPKHQEVGELLNTMNKGWIDQGKFAELLQGILF